jgi:hypothetical protein
MQASVQKWRDLLRNNSTVGGVAAAYILAGASGQTLSIIQRGIKANNFLAFAKSSHLRRKVRKRFLIIDMNLELKEVLIIVNSR